MTVIFWSSVAILVYTLIGYGVIWWVVARLFGRAQEPTDTPSMQVTLLIAAHNEAGSIAEKLANTLLLERGNLTVKTVVACDGCTDGTADIAREFEGDDVVVVDCKDHLGKTHVMKLALEAISSDVVVFTDANTAIEPDALQKLCRHFADEKVGGVCGAVAVNKTRGGWLGLAEDLYWRYDHGLKYSESRIAGAVSAQGSLYAVRRSLIGPIPEAMADDLVISLGVVASGHRLVFDPMARTIESVSSSDSKEFGRRVRSTERGWRGLMYYSTLLNPFKYGLYALQLFSHKVLRRLVPFLFAAAWLTSIGLAMRADIYLWSAWLFSGFVAVALMGLMSKKYLPRVLLLPTFLFMANIAMMRGVINAVSGKRTVVWVPTRD